MARCEAKRCDGEQCKAEARPGSTYCIFHDPAVAEKRREAKSRGGKASRKPPACLPPETPPLPLASVSDVIAGVGRTINDVLTGRLDTKIANAAGVLFGVLLRAIEGGDMEREVAELQREVAAIREAAKERPRG